MLRTEEAGLCAWVLSHTIFFIYVCITLHTVLSVCGHEYGHCHRCVFSLRQSFDQLGLELLRQMLNPPGSCLIPGCSPARLTVCRLSPWLQRWNCSRLYSHMAPMSTEEERKREEAGFRHRRAFAVCIKQLACSNTTRISDGNSDRTTQKCQMMHESKNLIFTLGFFLYFNSGLHNLGSRSTKQLKWVSLFQLSSTFFKTSNSKNMGLSPLGRKKKTRTNIFSHAQNLGLKFRLNNSKFKILFSEVSVGKSKYGDNNLKCWLLNLKAIVFPAAETGFHRLTCRFSLKPEHLAHRDSL